MSVTGCSAGSFAANATNPFKQEWQDFKGLRSALDSGDISQAQSAFANFQNDLQSASQNGKTSPLLDPNTQAGKDFQTLQSALQSGDVAGAQKAFAAVRQDMRSFHAHGHHHHHADSDGGDDSIQSAAPSQPSSVLAGATLNVTA